ncbi:MAG: ABC transporter substrate-binding protein [Alphaproteobacteria bacterium]|jgi:phospholipid transport system substrate-binding protein|nr:ABC transporter substrate-binding protein [Alphaproteobacteria bacterium]MDP6563566.1 ABC transporter substrate-binding protein [Alphaproteobacteria bacterium]MDP6814995.1 ABC transporter substrate-binding protein [Alphaproteobacteria bacterium]
MLTQFRLLLSCLCLGLLLALPAKAADDDPAQVMRVLADRAIAALSDESLNPARRQQAFRQLLRQGFDLPLISRFVLGRHWRRADTAQRQEFSQLFEDYLVAIYGRRLGRYSGQTMQITGQTVRDGKDALVRSRIGQPGAAGFLVDWRLMRRQGDWRVVDIVIEGVSMALAQRSEFAAVIRTSGGQVAGLLGVLRQKTQTLQVAHHAAQ